MYPLHPDKEGAVEIDGMEEADEQNGSEFLADHPEWGKQASAERNLDESGQDEAHSGQCERSLVFERVFDRNKRGGPQQACDNGHGIISDYFGRGHEGEKV